MKTGDHLCSCCHCFRECLTFRGLWVCGECLTHDPCPPQLEFTWHSSCNMEEATGDARGVSASSLRKAVRRGAKKAGCPDEDWSMSFGKRDPSK